MKCFQHPDRDALGLCAQCNKGLCLECAADLDFALACKDKHEEIVTACQRLTVHNTRPTRLQGQWFWPAFYVGVGIIFIYFNSPYGLHDFNTVLGAGLVVTGLVYYFYGRVVYRRFLKEYESRPLDGSDGSSSPRQD